ncbi:proteinase-activated receptor 4 [Pygocentrus nattereri]|uniref:Proteinase-activated receptor 4 n=1 Tax=Pygocentrus nattereri TaxID=42514 RepID=A0AAR2JEL9_PYGNA|nr:proteinase-activated receptor 4 [Pygocentrus nattereri]
MSRSLWISTDQKKLAWEYNISESSKAPQIPSLSRMAVSSGHHLFLLFFLFSLFSISSLAAEEECTTRPPRGRSFGFTMSGCNKTLTENQQKVLQSKTTVLLVPLLYLVAFIVGLPANLLAFWVLLFRTKKFPSTILLINLTSCDLLLLLLLPFRIVYHFQGNDWYFGEPFCRLVIALFYGNMYGSILCLTLIAVDRYVALVHPFGAKTLRSQKTSVYMSLAVWAMVLVAAAPLLASQQSHLLNKPSITTCHDALPKSEQKSYFLPYFATLFFLCFLLPLLVVLFCYCAVLRTLVAAGSRYSHAVKVTILILVVFVGCFLPSNVLLLMHYSASYLLENMSEKGDALYMPYMISLALSTFNSCLDPFIFYYVSEDFREKARKVLCLSSDSYESPSSGNQVSYSSGTSRSKVTLLSSSSRTTGDLDREPVRS